ncbi:hypothetical protein HHL16_02175 [Pseudoflavitalea sp. G-6-1-2]|uniref:hypothetical protein n=1 Tax=Pseudoflavitalea sp. G-6-1-2 TaxID=2728841 RepID=UPI00146F4A5D|nr:hypothetical protein [Pseudoflavitalea sp. G-6-1-2]NML19657.1 hypothetical protein [Pseudoflavitalea sp. G-6-1-2]
MKKGKSDNTNTGTKTPPGYIGILTLVILGIIPIVRSCIKESRKKEMRTIAKGMLEQAMRLDEVVTGDTGRIYVLTTTDSVRPKYRWYNGYKSLPNDSLQYQIILETEFTRLRFSRDTTVGQVVFVLKDVRSENVDSVGVHGIYFMKGTDEPDPDHMGLRRAAIYMREPENFRGWFVADTFNKDPESEEGKLAKRRLKRIVEELQKSGVRGFQMKVF